MEVGPFFRFSCFSAWHFLRNFFNTIVNNSSVNVEPLSPPLFKGKRPAIEKNSFSSFPLFAFAFFWLFPVFLDFRVPLARPIWSIWVHSRSFGSHSRSICHLLDWFLLMCCWFWKEFGMIFGLFWKIVPIHPCIHPYSSVHQSSQPILQSLIYH